MNNILKGNINWWEEIWNIQVEDKNNKREEERALFKTVSLRVLDSKVGCAHIYAVILQKVISKECLACEQVLPARNESLQQSWW